MKAIFKITAVAALMAAGLSSAMAASGNGQAQVLIHGEVVPVACTMGPTSANGPKDIDMGSWTNSDFKQGTVLYQNLYTVANSKRTFDITATGCSGVDPVENGQFLLKIAGPMTYPAQHIFADPGKTTTTAGFTLEAIDQSQSPPAAKLYDNTDEVLLHKFKSGEHWSDVNGTSVTFTTYMAANNATPGVGHAEAPVTFTVDYK